jgi:ribosomal protein S14
MTRKSAECFRKVKCESVVDKGEMTRNAFRTLAAKLGKQLLTGEERDGNRP